MERGNLSTSRLITTILGLAVITASEFSYADADAPDRPTLTINVDHKTQSLTMDGSTELAPGEKVQINITNTATDCFTYNAEQVDSPNQPPANLAAGNGKKIPYIRTKLDDLLPINTTHQKSTASYNILIAKVATPSEGCQSSVYSNSGFGLQPFQKSVSVTTVGWDVAFTAGAVIDGLTDRRYFLKDGGGGQYVVTRDSSAEDKTNQRLALFVHLVNTKWMRDSKSGVTWAPLTFGLGFDDKARYMLGTSARFGDQWFVTAGVVTGKRAGLPVGASEGMTTTNQNLLGTPGQSSSASWFIAVSFNFLADRAKSAVSNLFPTPSGGK